MDEETPSRQGYLEDFLDFGSQDNKPNRADHTQASFRHSNTAWTQSGQNMTQNWMGFTQPSTQSIELEGRPAPINEDLEVISQEDSFLEEVFGTSSKRTGSKRSNQLDGSFPQPGRHTGASDVDENDGFMGLWREERPYEDGSRIDQMKFQAQGGYHFEQGQSLFDKTSHEQGPDFGALHQEHESKSSSGMLSWFDEQVESKSKRGFGNSEHFLHSNPHDQSASSDFNQNASNMSLIEQDLAKLDNFFRGNLKHQQRHELPNAIHQGRSGNWGPQHSNPAPTASATAIQPHFPQSRNTTGQAWPAHCTPQPPRESQIRLEPDANMQGFFKYALTADASATNTWVEAHSTPRLLPALSKLAQALQHLLGKLANKQTVCQGAKHLVACRRLTDADLTAFLGYGKISVCKSSPKDVLDKILAKTVLYLLLKKAGDVALPGAARQLLEDGLRALLLI